MAIVSLAATLGLSSSGARAAADPARTIAAANQLERLVLVELNNVRRAQGLAPLRASAPLASAAEAHSRAMGRYGFFAHESRDGSPFFERVRRFYRPQSGAWAVGENLLWSTPGLQAKAAVGLWMKSPAHRQNILTARWREIGLSAVSVPGAPGVFGGRDVVIIRTDFGVR